MMAATKSIAAVVVIYYPGPKLIQNIQSYLSQVAILFAIDNSDEPDKDITAHLSTMAKVIYIANRKNLGIASALNLGAEKALLMDYDFLLTMDQDSYAAPDMVMSLLDCQAELNNLKIGIISPFHQTKSGKKPKKNLCYQKVMTPMTSGCLLYLKAYQDVGPFCDKLFIDFVDNEYCLRLRKNGYLGIQTNRAQLQHCVGNTKKYGPFIATNHPPLRRYYKTRNRFMVFDQYFKHFPIHCLWDRVRFVKEIASILFFETMKFQKLRMMWIGYRDYRRGIYGPFADRWNS